MLEKSTEYLPHVIYVLESASSPYDRFAAVIALRRFRTPETIDALFDAIKDPDYLVRNHALESLLTIYCLEPTISAHDDIFGLICTESDDEESYKKAIKCFEKAIELLKDLLKNPGKDE